MSDKSDLIFKIDGHSKLDGYENVLTGLGIAGLDSKRSTRYKAEKRMEDRSLGEFWSFNGLGKRVVKLPLQDAFREGFSINGDDDSEIFNYLKLGKNDKGNKTELWKSFKECARWADVYGGAIMVLGIKDGGELDDPVDEKRIDAVSYAHVFDKGQVNIYDIDTDSQSENFGQPEYYEVYPLNGSEVLRVHYSRVIRVDGEILPDYELDKNGYWHDSVYQAIFREIERSSTGKVSASRALDDLYIYTMKMKGLAQQIGQGNESKVIARLRQLDQTRSSMSMIGIDENESIERNTLTLSGVKDILVALDEAVTTVTGIPMSLLSGQPPKGLSNSDESGMTFYYDKVANKQEEQLECPLEKLIRYVMLSKAGPTNGKEIAGWYIEWNPIERQSETEIVNNRKTQAETDQIYMTGGVLQPQEVKTSRFGGLEQSLDTTIDPMFNSPTASDLAKTAQESLVKDDQEI
jgi:phage-related protein (TIGR01555 family)